MKGAKGGQRDQIISKAFHEMMEELKNKNTNENAVLDYEPKEKSLEEEKAIFSPLTEDDKIEIEDSNEYNKDKITEEEKKEEVKDQEEKKEEVVLQQYEEKKEEIKTEESDQTVVEEIIEQPTEEIIEEEQIEEEQVEEVFDNDEIFIFYQLEKMIKKDYYELKDIEYKIDLLSLKGSQTQLKENVEAIKLESEKLLARFDKLKDKYDELDVDGLSDVDNDYIATLLRDYKLGVKGSSEINNLIKKVEEAARNISVIETVVITELKQDDLTEEVEDKYEEYSIDEKEYSVLEEKVNNVDEIKNEISSLTKVLDKSINELEKKVTETVHIENKVERTIKRVPNINKVVSAVLMMAVASKIPKSPLGNIARAYFLASAIHDMTNIMEQKEDVKYTKSISYIDFSKDILKSENDLKDISKMIDNALLEVRNITYEVKQDLKDYSDQIPEYKELMDNLDKIEEQLLEQEYNINKYTSKINEQYSKEDQKQYIKEYEFHEN